MSTGYLIPDHVLTRELDGELVMLNLTSECYFGLDETGTIFWRALRAHDNLDDVKAQLLGEFEIGAETIETDLMDLVSELTAHGLLELQSDEPR